MELSKERLSAFDGLIGLKMTVLTETEVRGEVPVRAELKQPVGLIHGGVYAAIAETLASYGTTYAVAKDGKGGFGMANATSFLRPITEGTIHAVARVVHSGRTTYVWDVEMRDDAGRLCATTRMTIAVREPASRQPKH
jgi:uncharacterized protein (TIGR00369 family)